MPKPNGALTDEDIIRLIEQAKTTGELIKLYKVPNRHGGILCRWITSTSKINYGVLDHSRETDLGNLMEVSTFLPSRNNFATFYDNYWLAYAEFQRRKALEKVD